MKKLLIVLSLVLVGLSGCYVKGHDRGYHRDRDHHDQRGHDDHKGDRGGEHGDRDR